MEAPRYDYYQTDASVVVSVYVRGQAADAVRVEVRGGAAGAELHIATPAASCVLPLWADVDRGPDVRVLPSKIEITLAKATRGTSWPALVRDAPARDAPAAPTRSKWDTLALDDADDAPPKGSGDAELNAFFQQLYANADDDTRRAMVKSFQESGGTALSTNWAEVSQKKMEVQAPSGMEARRYEQ